MSLTYLPLQCVLTPNQSASFTLLWLADHPEYIDPLRDEVEQVIVEHGWTKAAMGKMWKLDSLLKEFQRHQGLSLGTHTFFPLVAKPITDTGVDNTQPPSHGRY